eukprot:2417680-Lingulodinium_polyedra.AAC.1
MRPPKELDIHNVKPLCPPQGSIFWSQVDNRFRGYWIKGGQRTSTSASALEYGAHKVALWCLFWLWQQHEEDPEAQ